MAIQFDFVHALTTEQIVLFSQIMTVDEQDGEFYPCFQPTNAAGEKVDWLFSVAGDRETVYTVNSAGEKVEWKALYNTRIFNFLEGQGPGGCDMYVPYSTTIGDKVYVWTEDGACGNSLIIADKPVKKSQLVQYIIDNHFDDEDDEDEDM